MGTNTKENEKEQGLENRNNMGKEKEIDKCPIDHKNHTIRAEGTFDRSETHTIKFVTPYDDAFDVFQPVPMKQAQQDWWRKLEIYANKDTEHPTGRMCPSMNDLMGTGYIIRTNKTIFVCQIPDPEDKEEPYNENPDFQCSWCHETCDPESETGKRHRKLHNCASQSIAYVIKDQHVEELRAWLKENEHKNRREMYFDLLDHQNGPGSWVDWRYEITGGHNGGQMIGSDYSHHHAIKFRQPWTIQTPEGTSCYWLDPFLKQNDTWTAMQGIIDTDGFDQIDTNCITIIYPFTDENFWIAKGTPILQIVPFVRTKWKHEIELSEDTIQEFMYLPEFKMMGNPESDGPTKNVRKHKNIYRKNFWEVKEFK